MKEIKTTLVRREVACLTFSILHILALFALYFISITIFCGDCLISKIQTQLLPITLIVLLLVAFGIYNVSNDIRHAGGITLPKSILNLHFLYTVVIKLIFQVLLAGIFTYLHSNEAHFTQQIFYKETLLQSIVFVFVTCEMSKSLQSRCILPIAPKYFTMELWRIYKTSLLNTIKLVVFVGAGLTSFSWMVSFILLIGQQMDGQYCHLLMTSNYLPTLQLTSTIILQNIINTILFSLSLQIVMELFIYFTYYPLDFSKLSSNNTTNNNETMLLTAFHLFNTNLLPNEKDKEDENESIIYQRMMTTTQNELTAYYTHRYTQQYHTITSSTSSSSRSSSFSSLLVIPYFQETFHYWQYLSHGLAWQDLSRLARLHSTRRQLLYTIHWFSLVHQMIKILQMVIMQIQIVNDYLLLPSNTTTTMPNITWQGLFSLLFSSSSRSNSVSSSKVTSQFVDKAAPFTSSTTATTNTTTSGMSTTSTKSSTSTSLSIEQLSQLRRRYDPLHRTTPTTTTPNTPITNLLRVPESISPIPLLIAPQDKQPLASTSSSSRSRWYTGLQQVPNMVFTFFSSLLPTYLYTLWYHMILSIPILGELQNLKEITMITPETVRKVYVSTTTQYFLKSLFSPSCCQLIVNMIESIGWLLHYALQEDSSGMTMKTVVVLLSCLLQLDIQLQIYMNILHFATLSTTSTTNITNTNKRMVLLNMKVEHYVPKELLMISMALQEMILLILRDYQDILVNLSLPDVEIQRLLYYKAQL